MPGTERDVRVTMPDGVRLAATLYLPDPADGPQPCLLEALPYRKDDLTSSYAATYRRLRDEFGYAVCRLDLRGTGSSEGDATDEYPEIEQADLVEVIAWLAAQDWCDGGVGMWGTSYSGFNSLQIACERPPALKAVCAIYSSDDRWTDDVHWRGGALRLVDLVDYCHYMTPMSMLPPVPAVWGDGWREEWRRRLETQEPWVLTWLRENRDGAYWRHGSVRADGDGNGYDRIDCAVMLVAGWADGYRNNSFRTVEALRRAGVPHRLLAGPWVHAAPVSAYPGPRLDLDVEMAAWFDRWLRGRATEEHRDGAELYVRAPAAPEPDLEEQPGRWVRTDWPSSRSSTDTRTLSGPQALAVRPDTGVAAWIDCAGHLPWGLSVDQREDDAHSLTWEWDAAGEVLVGHPRVRLRVSADAPQASLSVKLCDVAPDGTSVLVSRGSLDLAYRDGVHAPVEPSPLTPGRAVRRPRRSRRVRLRGPRRATPAALGRRRRLAEHRRTPGPGDAHRPRRRARPALLAGRRGAAADVPARPAPLLRGRLRRVVDRDPRRAAPHHHLRGRPRQQLRRAARRHRDRALHRRGHRRPAHLRPARLRDVHLRPHLARRRRPGHLDDAGRRTRRGLRRGHRRRRVRRRDEPVSHRTWTERIPR